MTRISFVIPLYNAGGSVRELTERLLRLSTPGTMEIIYVNDGSTDDTDAKVRDLAANNMRIKYIALAGNFGQHNAILTALPYTTGNAVVCLDDDLQTPPEESIRLLKALHSRSVNVVYGAYETNDDTIRRIGTRLHNAMAFLFGKPTGVTLTSFFCMSKDVAQKVCRYRGGLVYLPGLVLRATGNITSIPVRHERRKYGRSGYTVSRLAKLWFIGLLTYLRLSDFFTSKPAAVIRNTVNV